MMLFKKINNDIIMNKTEQSSSATLEEDSRVLSASPLHLFGTLPVLLQGFIIRFYSLVNVQSLYFTLLQVFLLYLIAASSVVHAPRNKVRKRARSIMFLFCSEHHKES